MSNYYLRVEAVNLDNSIFDTYKISAIRGGSFMLFDAVKALESDSSVSKNLTKVSEGASTGLYQLQRVGSDTDAEKLREKVLAVLRKNAPAATFVVDYHDFDSEDCADDFSKGVKMLMAKNRWSQWRQPTVILPAVNPKAEKACTLDGVRPGVHVDREGKISDATSKRLKFGRKLRNDLYKTILKDDKIDVKFTEDLGSLSSDSQKGNLNGKIAFIYLDGNKFGRIRDVYCQTDTDLKNFDQVVQEDLRASILRNILARAKDNPHFKTSDGQLRLETLLWGGDEIEWVVPAWLGWKVLQMFYLKKLPFEIKSEDERVKEIPLTHACGIVFCSHSAPILQIRKIAHDLANKAKETINGIPETHDQGNFIQYLVLESFDMLEGSLKSFVDHYYQPGGLTDLMIKGGDIATFEMSFKTLHAYFPRSKVFEIVAALKESDQDVESIEKKVEDITKKALSRLGDDLTKVLGAIDNITTGNTNRWYLIADMWDYFKELK